MKRLEAISVSQSLLRAGLEPTAAPGPFFAKRVMAVIRAEEDRLAAQGSTFWSPLQHLAARIAMAAAVLVMGLTIYAYTFSNSSDTGFGQHECSGVRACTAPATRSSTAIEGRSFDVVSGAHKCKVKAQQINPGATAVLLVIAVFVLGIAIGVLGTYLEGYRVFGSSMIHRTRPDHSPAAQQRGRQARVEQMTKDLNLTPDQQQKLDAALAQMSDDIRWNSPAVGGSNGSGAQTGTRRNSRDSDAGAGRKIRRNDA